MGKTTAYHTPGHGEIELYLSQKGYTFNSCGAENIKLKICPLCGHKDSFAINTVSGQFKCFFTECEKQGNFVTLRRHLQDPIPSDKIVKNFSQDWRDFFAIERRVPVTENKFPQVLKYLHDRGFSNETLDAFRVSNYGERGVRFPMYAWENGSWEIVNSRIIQVLGDKRNWFEVKGGPTHLLLGNHLQKDSIDKTVYIFEGQWDVLTAYELGLRNVFSLPNGASCVKEEFLQYIPQDWNICLGVDMDPSGDACAQKFFEIFTTRVSRIHMPEKDLNDWYKSNKSLTAKMVLDKRRHVIIQREKNYRKIRRNIPDQKKQKPLVDTPFEGLTTLMGGGFFPSQMTSILAGSGAGKTTLVNQIAVYVANQGVKIGLISLEGCEDELDEKLDKTISGTIADKSDKDILENLLVSSLKGKKVSHAQVIEEATIMVKDDDCRVIIVDNLDYISSSAGTEKNETTAALMDLTNSTASHLIQIWQCKKVDPMARVNSGTQKGESKIFQDSHNYISLNSILPDGKELDMEKNRKMGRGKFLVHLDYNFETNTYREIKKPENKLQLKLLS